VCRTIPKTGRYNQAYENFIKRCATNDVFDIVPFLSSRTRKFFIAANDPLACFTFDFNRLIKIETYTFVGRRMKNNKHMIRMNCEKIILLDFLVSKFTFRSCFRFIIKIFIIGASNFARFYGTMSTY
jgi:hypothetical protein